FYVSKRGVVQPFYFEKFFLPVISTEESQTIAGISDDMLQVQVSIIVPVFNEAQLIQPFLARLRERAPGAEIIVVDGASTDGTDQLAAGLCDQLVATGEPSRATQMNAGARAASSDIFWFLHADADVPARCLD